MKWGGRFVVRNMEDGGLGAWRGKRKVGEGGQVAEAMWRKHAAEVADVPLGRRGGCVCVAPTRCVGPLGGF